MVGTTCGVGMDSRQISLVKESFEKVVPYSNKMTRVLYDQLFELSPELRPLFKKDLREQRKKFLKALMLIVASLHDAKLTEDIIHYLGEKHINVAVSEKDYETFGKALIFAISACLGDDFTPAVKAAWKNTYSTLVKIQLKYAVQDSKF